MSKESNYYTWNVEDEVKLRDDDTKLVVYTIPQLLMNTVNNDAKSPYALRMQKDIGEAWNYMSYSDYQSNSLKVARSLIHLGLEESEGVAIIGFNHISWHLAFMGAIHAGGIGIGVYTTNAPEVNMHCLNLGNCSIIFVEDINQLKKIREIREKLNNLKAIIMFMGAPDVELDNNVNEYNWIQFIEMGDSIEIKKILEKRIMNLKANKCCSIVFTSGTTGFPKAVMLSHDNLVWTAKAFSNEVAKEINISYGNERLVSYLPLSHIAAQILDIIAPILFGSTIYFAQPSALKGTLGLTLNEVEPTLFLGVPRVYEKINEKIMEKSISNPTILRKIGRWAKRQGYKQNITHPDNIDVSLSFKIAEKVVFKKLLKALGLEKCKYIFYGAAPMSEKTMQFFLCLNIKIYGIFGMSETTGPQTVMPKSLFSPINVGIPYFGTKIRIDETNKELQIYGRNIFMGYKDNPEKTVATFTDDFYLKSGDQGALDEKGFLSIIGRIKDLIITAGGENIATGYIENNIINELPIISNVVIIGDKRKYLSSLLTFKSVVDVESMKPKNQLTAEAIDWLKSIGSRSTTVREAMIDEIVLQEIQAGVTRANLKAINKPSMVKKWAIVPRDFSLPFGELGPTMKLKKHVVYEMYDTLIENMYQ
ncbi:hypothetical protein A3Q56_05438 [Intoshia linei]|uniref:long-chain-fatty-acid--CoA ligase n=1 Tax=Intoshia linei TaxID=1819745 RepID=A0A177AY83_9BILA|nr:hypothetical protein A3Q56_05438 [Intoshia linei]